MFNRRLFPRIKVNFKVGFEFVKWNEADLDHCKTSYEASIVDISANGARLSGLPEIDDGIMKKLSTGKNKIRLNFSLYENSVPINTFARLVWQRLSEDEGACERQCGFEFIDIPATSFERLKEFVDSKAV